MVPGLWVYAGARSLIQKGRNMTDVNEGQVGRELPKYKCHKEVWALKIKEIRFNTREDGAVIGATITPAEKGYRSFDVDNEYLRRAPKIEPGGYFVVYKDGYRSYSPAAAFEEGYTRI